MTLLCIIPHFPLSLPSLLLAEKNEVRYFRNEWISDAHLFSPLTGDLESAPVLRTSGEGGCFYEFEWHTAAACVLSKTEGENCTVFDSQAGLCPSRTSALM